MLSLKEIEQLRLAERIGYTYWYTECQLCGKLHTRVVHSKATWKGKVKERFETNPTSFTFCSNCHYMTLQKTLAYSEG